MDNKEEKNIPQIDDFEIIDIPMDSGAEINDNINIANNMSQIQEPVGFDNVSQSSIEETVQTPEIINPNDIYQNETVNEQPVFGAAEINVGNEQDVNYNPSYSEIPQNSVSTSFNEIPQQASDFNDQVVQNNSYVDNNQINPEVNMNYNPVENPQMNIENEINPDTINTNSNGTEQASNVYIPKREVKNDKNEPKEKMDKSIKEMIIMGIIIAIVIMFLPTLYNLSTGKYNVIDNIKNTFGGLFAKEEKVTTTEETTTEEEPVEEITTEEEKVEQNSLDTTTLSFDFSSYNNQVVDGKNLKILLNSYANNIISLSPTVENGKQVYKIEIAKDVTNVEYSISNPESALESFIKQYLSDSYNYLITVGNVNDNVIVISAIQQ